MRSTRDASGPMNSLAASQNFSLSSTMSTDWNIGSRSLLVIRPMPAPQSKARFVPVLPPPIYEDKKGHINTIQLYCQVTNAQGMCYGTKHTHTHSQSHQSHTHNTQKSKNVKVVQRVNCLRLRNERSNIKYSINNTNLSHNEASYLSGINKGI